MAKGRLHFDGDNVGIEKEARIYSLTDDVERKINSIPNVIDNTSSTSATDALSANMGRDLQEQINNLASRGRYLSTWNAEIGLPDTNPQVSPYVYRAGDYYIVSKVVSGTNYRPHGSSYVIGEASTDVETESISVNDLYIYDGAQWIRQGSGSGATITWGSIVGVLSNQSDLQNALDNKQDELTAGDGISIDANNVISNTLPGAVVDATAPSNPSQGDLWYDTTNNKLKTFDGTQWNETGVTYVAGNNIQINGTTISATDTEYSAGRNISINGTTISARDTEYTAGSNVTITCPVKVDNQGPCPDGFHVPTKTERGDTMRILNNVFGFAANHSTPETYLKMPDAGCRYFTTGVVQDHGGYYWSSTPVGPEDAGFFYYYGPAFYYPENSTKRSQGCSIRPFKDNAVTPDSSWTVIYDGSSIVAGAGIFHNAIEGLISISGDGINWTTIADKNLGATTVWNNGDAKTQANCGNHYQRGNNYGFPFSGTVDTKTTKPDASGHGPGNYYYSSTYTIVPNSPWDWSSVQNDNLWGGANPGTFQDCEHPIISAAGGATYTAGDGVNINQNNEISVDNTVARTSDTYRRFDVKNPAIYQSDAIAEVQEIYDYINNYSQPVVVSCMGANFMTPLIDVTNSILYIGGRENTYHSLSPHPLEEYSLLTCPFDSNGNILSVTYTNTQAQSPIITSGTAPVGQEGLLWYDTTNNLLKIYTGTTWISTGSSTTYTAGNGININANNEISADTTVVATQADIANFFDKTSDDADDIDDTNSTNKFVTVAEKSTWSGKQDELTAGNNITIEDVCHLDNQGPCPDGYHVPSSSEWTAVKTVWTSLGGGGSDGTNFGIALKLPFAGAREFSTASAAYQGSYGAYWASTRDTFYSHYLFLNPTDINASDSTYGASGLSIRPFKNTPVIPTSYWTKLYGTSIESGGIFRSAYDGLISLSSDGSTWITMADKNLGAETYWISGDTLAEENCGKYYQWGNNYGFPFTGTLTDTSTTQVDASGYGPGNYYSSSTFIKYSGSWDSSNDDNLWGGVSQGTRCQNIISATNTTYTAGNGIDITNNEISADTTVLATKTDLTSKADASDVNTKTFYLSSTSDLTTAQAAYDWYKAGKEPIIVYDKDTYITYNNSDFPTHLSFVSADLKASGSTVTALNKKILVLAQSSDIINNIQSGAYTTNVLRTDYNYPTPYTPQYNGSPATKKYVDDEIANIDLSTKQDKLIAGANIQIASDGKTISATDTTYTAGTGLSLSGTQFSVDNAVVALQSDLANYYTTSQTYSKTEVDNLISSFGSFTVVDTLPTTASADEKTIYLLGPIGTGADKYEEWIITRGAGNWASTTTMYPFTVNKNAWDGAIFIDSQTSPLSDFRGDCYVGAKLTSIGDETKLPVKLSFRAGSSVDSEWVGLNEPAFAYNPDQYPNGDDLDIYIPNTSSSNSVSITAEGVMSSSPITWELGPKQWTKIGETSVDLSDLNTKSFYLANTSDLTTAQAAYDWYVAGKNPIIIYQNIAYILSGLALYSSNYALHFIGGTSISTTEIDNNKTTPYHLSGRMLDIEYNSSSEAIAIHTYSAGKDFLPTNSGDEVVYTPTENWDPATKKYVDDKVTASAAAPSYPTEGQLWYDTTNDVLKVYDGTAWKEAGTQMKVLSYGNSTWQDFIDAYNKNAIVYCRASSQSNPATGTQGRLAFMAYVNNADNPTEVEFQYYRSRSDHNSAANQVDEVYVYKLTSNGTRTVTQRNTAAKAVAGTGINLAFGSGNMTISADTTTLATQNDISIKTFYIDSNYTTTEIKEIIDYVRTHKAGAIYYDDGTGDDTCYYYAGCRDASQPGVIYTDGYPYAYYFTTPIIDGVDSKYSTIAVTATYGLNTQTIDNVQFWSKNFIQSSGPINVKKIWAGTTAQYNALSTYDEDTIYIKVD